MLLVLAAAIFIARRAWNRDEPASSPLPLTLDAVNKLHAAGKLTDDERATLRAAILARHAIDPEDPSARAARALRPNAPARPTVRTAAPPPPPPPPPPDRGNPSGKKAQGPDSAPNDAKGGAS